MSWVILGGFVVLSLAMLSPIVLAVINSVKTSEEYARNGPLALPEGFDLSGLTEFWVSVDFTNKLLNSVLISVGVAALGVVLSLLTAYGLGVGRVRGRFWILALFMVAFTLPQEALVYPLYFMSKNVGLYDSQLAVIIIIGVLQAAFGTYLLSSVLSSVPDEVLEAARVDGAGRFRILTQIVTPLVRPTLMVLGAFFFVWTWNEFFIPLVLLPSGRNQTVSVALGSLFGQYTSDPVTTAAAAVVGILPALVFFILFQRTLMRGVNMGAVK
ncbi:carbohydrate ABC transporter permease [Demequina lignilytica]|uniref:Carbohydrate ABC transporter permease n=1 Tax=Demequina lignilytica TaxID=3051663 RepID=A0AAW7M2M0_9MICO|nr:MULTISPECIES: carbohydrate ABC transporter permease [unclassified Demequina]MDN4479212.1 carbohydrate ABC transporter permease [Demequina sp. SYSU T00039-1]MDN4484438.1 carbohydrate ABC transporter permease [Demequina sp. SYSU T0a273]MDN4487929.1 carbohydrate ABC transporter permease [Demequina sp. SYSU T00039]MDN4491735.1 carbohydrate ABC transporter permease [Demequina sp. SYSU T00068]